MKDLLFKNVVSDTVMYVLDVLLFVATIVAENMNHVRWALGFLIALVALTIWLTARTTVLAVVDHQTKK